MAGLVLSLRPYERVLVAGTVLLLVGGATSLGFGLDLDPSARRPPVLAAGIVAGLTLYLAATERVAASLPKVVAWGGRLAPIPWLSSSLICSGPHPIWS